MTAKHISTATEWPAVQPDSSTRARQRILVVDDDEMTRRLNAEVLRCSGYEVDTAIDGAEAWAELNDREYDLLITDNEMPGFTGIDLIAEIHAAGMTLPIIMATGNFPAEKFASTPWLRPTANLLKPYTVSDLVETVQAVLRAATSSRLEITPLPSNWLSASPPDNRRTYTA